jgi:CxxC motif-containing protein (DUF1111 family)
VEPREVFVKRDPHRMLRKKSSILFFLFTALIISFGVVAQQQTVTEAPTGYTTPALSLSPGIQGVSNGMVEPAGDTFALDQAQFERRHDTSNGLGPEFNATSCAECHQNLVVGTASQFTEVRAGHLDAGGNFVNPTIPVNDGAANITGRSIVNDRATCEAAQERLPDSENVRTLRAVLSVLGDGFVEAVEDTTLLAIAANQPNQSNGLIHGEPIIIPLLEAPTQTMVGRFGWKDQQPSVLSFVGDAYLNEMGVTNRLRPNDVTSICKTGPNQNAIEDVVDSLGMADIDHFAQFIRATQAPPRDATLAASSDAQTGQALFKTIGCVTCHVDTLITARTGTVINGGTYIVPAALGNKTFHPFGDFLLHDVGTGDGIVQAGPADTANKIRTAPLWGLHIKSRFMHDNESHSVANAIKRHAGEATAVVADFNALSAAQQQQIITFLNSL